MDKTVHPIRQCIRYVHGYLLDVRARIRLKRLALKERCLAPGVYRMIHSRRYYLVRIDIPDSFLYSLGVKKNKHQIKDIVIRDSDDAVMGQAMMVTAYGFKIFDVRNGIVYKKLVSDQESISLKKAIELLTPCFQNTYIGIRKGFSEEKLIYGKPRKEWQLSDVPGIYFSIVDSYLEYFNTDIDIYKAPYDRTDILRILNPKYEILKIYQGLLLEIGDCNYPYIYMHGDMHFGNIIYDGHVWYIDFECAREEIFFYDLFNVLYVEYVDCQNSMLLDMYFAGNTQMINKFKRAFMLFDTNFSLDNRKIYFKTYLLARIRYDILDLFNKYSGQSLNKGLERIASKNHRIVDYINSH